MVFLFDEHAGAEVINPSPEQKKHLKARRARPGAQLALRNLRDEFLYFYRLVDGPALQLCRREPSPPAPVKGCLALALIDPREIERILPALNELGLARLLIIRCERSQNNFCPNPARMRRILIASCEQCGRASLMGLDFFHSAAEFRAAYPEAVMVDFTGGEGAFEPEKIYFIGPEGGFSVGERELFSGAKRSLKSPLILRSAHAALAVAAKILI